MGPSRLPALKILHPVFYVLVQQKRPRPLSEVAAGASKLVAAFLLRDFRARLAGPLAREGEAVRKGEC
jgi:hypothetical protein